MLRLFPLALILCFLASCSRQMFPDKTTGQTTSKKTNGGIAYPDGSIHYPDGSVKTTDGMIWPAKKTTTTTTASKNTKTSSTTHPRSIADEPNVTVVSRGATASKTSGTKTTASTKSKTTSTSTNSSAGKTTVKNNLPKNNNQKDNVDVVILDTNGDDNSFPGNEQPVPQSEVNKTNSSTNTSARKDATGRHARKRGENYLRK